MKDKRVKCSFIVTVMIVAALTGSFSLPVSAAKQEPVTITFWEWRGGALAEFLEEETRLFHERYPWITIEMLQFPNRRAYREALALAFASEDAPDVFIRPSNLSQMIEDEWIQPLDPWITAEWKEKFPEGSFAETKNVWQGKTYSFPAFAIGFPRMLFINEDMFRQAGLIHDNGDILTPKTWGELRSMAAQVTEAGSGEFYGIGIGIKDSRNMGWWFDLASLAGTPMTPYDFDFRTGQYVYGTHSGYAQVIELLLGMKADGSVYPYESTLDDSNLYVYFDQGKFAIFMSGSHVISNLEKDFPDFQDYQVIPLPVPDQGQKGDMQLLPGIGVYFMSSRTAHPDETWLWLDWLSSREFHKRMVVHASNFSVFADLNTPENISDEHKLQAYRAQSAYGIYGPFPPARNPETALVVPDAVTPDEGELLVGIYTEQIKDWRQALVDLDTRKQKALDAAIKQVQERGADVSLDDFIFPDWNPMENYVTHPKK